MKTVLAVIVLGAAVAALSIGVVIAQSETRTEVRIAAQRLETGRIEFALQQREPDGEWGDRILPTRRFFPASGREGRWLTSSPLELTIPTPTPGPTLTVAEYADWCASGGGIEEIAEDATWRDYSLMLDSAIDQGLAVSPPDLLRDFHDARIQGLILVRLTSDDSDPDAALSSADVLGPGLLYALWVARAEEALAEDVRTTLEEAGCIDTGDGSDELDEPTSTPTPAPIPAAPATPTPTPAAAIGDVVAVGRVDVVVHAIERDAFRTTDGVSTTRVDIEFTNTRGAIETVSYWQVDGIDTEGLKMEPYDVCHEYDRSLGGYPCPGVLVYEEINPGASVRGYIYFVESPVYPLAFIELWKRTGRGTIERVAIEIPAP